MAGEDNTQGFWPSVWRGAQNATDAFGFTHFAQTRASENLQNVLQQMSDAYKQYRVFAAKAAQERLGSQFQQTVPMQQYLHSMIGSDISPFNTRAAEYSMGKATGTVTGMRGPEAAAQAAAPVRQDVASQTPAAAAAATPGSTPSAMMPATDPSTGPVDNTLAREDARARWRKQQDDLLASGKAAVSRKA